VKSEHIPLDFPFNIRQNGVPAAVIGFSRACLI